MVKKIFEPEYRIVRNEFDEYHCKYSSNIIKKQNCEECSNYDECFIWRDNEFNHFCKVHEYCDSCKFNPLERGYLYIRYLLISKNPSKYEEYFEKIGYFCCFCSKKKKF